MPSPTPAFLELHWLLPLFVVLWTGLSALLATLAGWPWLAKRFASEQPVTGETFRFASGSMGATIWLPVSYRCSLFYTVADSGLHMSVLVLFRLLSPPLFIPWEQVASINQERVWLLNTSVIRLRDTPIMIMVRGRVADAVNSAYARYTSRKAIP